MCSHSTTCQSGCKYMTGMILFGVGGGGGGWLTNTHPLPLPHQLFPDLLSWSIERSVLWFQISFWRSTWISFLRQRRRRRRRRREVRTVHTCSFQFTICTPPHTYTRTHTHTKCVRNQLGSLFLLLFNSVLLITAIKDNQPNISSVGGGCGVQNTLTTSLWSGKTFPHNECAGYDTNAEVSDQKIWGIWSTHILSLLPGQLWRRVVVPVRVLSINQIELANHLLYLKLFNCVQTTND